MFNSIAGTKIPSIFINKFKNKETESPSEKPEPQEKKQKLSYPSLSLQKAYFVPSFAGTVTQLPIVNREARESTTPSTDGANKVADLNESIEKTDLTMASAIGITRNADIIYVNAFSSNFPVSLNNVKVESGTSSWHIEKENPNSFLQVNYDQSDEPLETEDNERIKLSQQNKDRLLSEVKKHPLVKSMDELGIKSPGLVKFIDTLIGLTNLPGNNPNKLIWKEQMDGDNQTYLTTKYKNHNVDLRGNDKSGYKIGISKADVPTNQQSVLIFESIDEELAHDLEDNVIQSGYTRYEDTQEAQRDKKQEFKDLGFLNVASRKDRERSTNAIKNLGFVNVSTDQDKEKLARLLKSMGFVHKEQVK